MARRKVLTGRYRPTKFWLGFAVLAWSGLFATGLTIPSQPYRDYLRAYAGKWDPMQNGHGPRLAEDPPAGSPTSNHATSLQITEDFKLTFSRSVAALLIALLCYTPTNVVLMCMVSSTIGSVGVRLARRQAPASDKNGQADKDAAATTTEKVAVDDGNNLTSIAENDAIDKPAANGKPADDTEQTRGVGAVPGLCVFLLLTSGMILIDGVDNWINTTPDFYGKFAATASLFSIAAGMNPSFMQDLASLFSVNRYHRKPTPTTGTTS